MRKEHLFWVSGLVVFFFCSPVVFSEEVVVSPLMCGANSMYDMAGLYYGTLPASAPGSRRAEFIKLLKEREIHALRFPGGTWADTEFLVDNEEMMRSVLGKVSIPEGDPKKFIGLWQFLDFCKEAGITPIYQVNPLLYCDGSKVYQLMGEKPINPKVVVDHSKRADAARDLTSLVKKVRAKGFTVKHWEFGNEEYAGIPAGEYSDVSIRYAKAIWAADAEAMLWVTLGSNHCSEADRKMIPPWSEAVLKELQKAGFTSDKNLGFTLHYVWPEYITFHTNMVKKYGFKPRFAVTEFHMAGLGDYSDLCPRFGYALGLAPYLISMVVLPSVEILCIHELTSQNFGIIHYNQRSYGPPGMQTWDAALGYQSMPSAYVYELFGKLIGGKILNIDTQNSTRLVVELGKERRIFFVNSTVNPMTVEWSRSIVGQTTKSFECRTILPNVNPEPVKSTGGVSAQALGQSGASRVGDPLRADQILEQKQAGKVSEGGLTLTVPSYSISYVRCFE
jgi:hypothetical protein